ncbi:hypothetical protein BESB_027780 [Besnoitia besnoiti]|uniref:START-2 domain protein n=1 Tax=Besnoitia besnoiti TaxID=94643 RepID=A0A2A9M6T4_BESBE|nr:uncharacterized protein BESB_027780 [Besnoitia besnoiti]PFH31343.1 hypothetical protein BESB_027780 [Besnoitia besnoiti]
MGLFSVFAPAARAEGAPVAAAESPAGLRGVVQPPSPPECTCFSRFLCDKRVIQEQVFLERHVDAFHLLARLYAQYPPHLLQNDPDLVEVVYRFSLTDSVYRILEQDACAAKLRERPKAFSRLAEKLSFSSLHSAPSCPPREADCARREDEEGGGAGRPEGERRGEGGELASPDAQEKAKSETSLRCCSAETCSLRQFCETGECSCLRLAREWRGPASFPEGPGAPGGRQEGETLTQGGVSVHAADKGQTGAENAANGCSGLPESMRPLAGSLLEAVLAQPIHPLVTGKVPGPWHCAVSDGTMSVYVRNYEDNRELLTFRIEGESDAPLLSILSVLNEVDLFKLWVPYYSQPFKLGLRQADSTSMGRVDQLVQFHVDFPWPFSNRDALFEVWAVDDFERNSQIVVKMTTLDHENPSPRARVPVPKPAKGVERMCVDGSLVISPRGSHSSFLRLVWHENCRMRVPMKMVDFVSSIVAKGAFNSFRAACKTAMDGEHQERRKKNRFLYGFIENRLAEVGLHGEGLDALKADRDLSGSQATAETEVKREVSEKFEQNEDEEEFFDAEEGVEGGGTCAASARRESSEAGSADSGELLACAALTLFTGSYEWL